ncbi:MAG: hypothetical protein PHI88_00245 [Candidatus Pacebacteria bacterium]|nr:hypothetical protein [Candidatus Paceibacterota bacterium]
MNNVEKIPQIPGEEEKITPEQKKQLRYSKKIIKEILNTKGIWTE